MTKRIEGLSEQGLEEVTGAERPDDLLAQARRCRRLANTCGDQQTADALNRLAEEYEARAGARRSRLADDRNLDQPRWRTRHDSNV